MTISANFGKIRSHWCALTRQLPPPNDVGGGQKLFLFGQKKKSAGQSSQAFLKFNYENSIEWNHDFTTGAWLFESFLLGKPFKPNLRPLKIQKIIFSKWYDFKKKIFRQTNNFRFTSHVNILLPIARNPILIPEMESSYNYLLNKPSYDKFHCVFNE